MSHRAVATFLMVLLTALWALPGGVQAQHSVYLQTPNTIPSYCQETSIWCGAATAQMALEGYPGGVNHVFTQTHIWNRIQAHLDDPAVNWATDPDGLRETLMELGGDPGVSWVIYANPSATSLMHTVAYWMTRRHYPVPVLVRGFQHWILVEGVTTNLDPTQNSTVTLQWIEVTDPSNPPCPNATSGGIKSLMSGSSWYTNYWYAAGNHPTSKWHGNFIAVVEPPVREGVAEGREQVVRGKPISRENAVEAAMRGLQEARALEKEPYSILRNKRPLKPFPVNPESRGYYLVPWGYEESGLSQGAVLVNLYSGEFQEVGVFARPRRYVDEEDAIRLGLRYLCGCGERDTVRAELIFEPSALTQSRFLPIWRITSERGTVYVTQDREVFPDLIPNPLGDRSPGARLRRTAQALPDACGRLGFRELSRGPDRSVGRPGSRRPWCCPGCLRGQRPGS